MDTSQAPLSLTADRARALQNNHFYLKAELLSLAHDRVLGA